MYLTYSELKDQYNALEKAAALLNGSWGEAKRLFERNQPRAVVFLGCGSSYSIAQSLAAATMMHMKTPAVALPAGDYMLHSSSYSGALDGALAVAISRSGSTSELVEAVERLKADLDAPVISLVAAVDSPLAALSDMTVEMPWCFDQSVCQTRTVSCLYFAGMLLIARLAGADALADGLLRAVTGGPAYLQSIEQDLKTVAEKPWTNAVVLADAELAGIASEAALAFREICQRPGSFYHVLDVRHGPMVLIRPDTLVIAALSNGNQYELDLVADIAKKGAGLIVYSDIPLDVLPDRTLNVSFGKSLPHAARGLPFLLIAQLVSYHKAIADGVNPDEPSGLDPWIKL